MESTDEIGTEIAARGRRFQAYRCDLGDRKAVLELTEQVSAGGALVDILVLNAGTIERRAAAEHPDELWDRVLEVNLSSQFVLAREFGRRMVERGEGKIIFVASLLSFQGGINVPGYAASKGGVAQLTKALANEWAAHGVNVNAIAPGYIATDNTQTAPRGRDPGATDSRADSRRPVGNARRRGRRIRLPCLGGGRLRSWGRSPGRWRLARPMTGARPEAPRATSASRLARSTSDRALARRAPNSATSTGPIDDGQARATVEAAWAEGIRYFDTAPHYGLGLSERRLGAALSGRARSDYVLSTKVGRLLEPTASHGLMDDGGFAVPAEFRRVWDFSRDGVLRSLAESLERLGVDRVDIVYLHDPDDHRDDAFLRAYPALEELRSQGLVKAIGAGMNQSAMLADFARHTDVDVLMLAGRYTLLEQSALDDLLPVCADRGVAVVAAGVFNSGLLAQPMPSPTARYEYREAPGELVDRATRIAAACKRHGTTLPAAALAFPLAHPAVVSVCIGAHLPEQVVRNTALGRAAVPGALWVELKEEGLLRRDAPVPAV